MQVFKCALKLTLRKPLFLLVYTVALSFMGVAMAQGLAGGSAEAPGNVERASINYAYVDRDGGQLAAGIGDFLETKGTAVEVEDTALALQDAVAKGAVDFILIAPEGWSAGFAAAAKNGSELPKMESVYSFYSAEGALMDADLANFAGLLATCIAAEPDASPSAWVDGALEAASAKAPATVADFGQAETAPGFTFFLQFSIYSLFASIVVCITMLLGTLNRVDVRRRNLASPVSYGSYTLQTLLACLVVVLAIDGWTLGLGLAVFHDSAAALGSDQVSRMALTVVVFSMVPLGLGFLLGQMGVKSTAANAVGNIVALVLSFLGGAWVPLSIVPGAVGTVARFLPGYWYTEALVSGGWGQAASCWAVLLLYAAALCAVTLALGRARLQTSDAGGNAAAEVAL